MKKKKAANKQPRIKFYQDERYKFLFGVFMLFLAAFFTLSFISYLFTWKIDQSFAWSKVFSGANISVDNWSGKIGASISNFFINKTFGVASFIIPIVMLILGLRLFKIKIVSIKILLKQSLVILIILSIWFGYIFQETNGYLGSGLGGSHGFFVSSWINALMGKAGTAFILIIFSAGFILFSYSKSWEFIKNVGSLIIGERTKRNPIRPDVTSVNTEPIKPEPPIDKGSLIKDIPQTEPPSETKKEEVVEPAKEKVNESKPDEEGNGIELTIEEKLKEESSDASQVIQELENYDPTLDLASYEFPTFELLDDHGGSDQERTEINKDEIIENKNRIVETLGNYKIQIDKIKATIGPTVTLYEIIPAPGIRISKIKNLEDDIALSLAALGIRIIAPIPGRGTIGIEVPNQKPEIVSMLSVLTSMAFQDAEYELPIALGKTISNETFVIDLVKMPHMLVAGATGQGKSVGLNAIITSLLYKKHPAQLKFVFIDPKKVELTLYSKIENHFLAKLPGSDDPIITDTQKVIHTLNSLCSEMDERYNLLKLAHVRNIKEYNAKFIARKLNPEKGHKYLPYIVFIVDEFADLIMTAGKDIEGPIARLAQLARAIGIHLIIATQRPSANIITGVIKANFPARLAFRVTSMIDSRTILDSSGANQLIGRGDMLISTGSDLTRLQCAFIDTPELDRITEFISAQRGYPTAFMLPEYVDETADEIGDVDLSQRDELFEEAARMVVRHQQGSTSLIQRKFSIGYNRAGRIIDQLEAANIVGPFEGSKARQVLFQDEYALEQYLRDFIQK